VADEEKQNVQSLDFPPQDLLNELIDIHFRISHCTMPIIHEPRFRKRVQEGLHRQDLQFGRLVMMMCALSSRDSDDPRVLVPWQMEYSAGWTYYKQVHIVHNGMFEPSGLCELQMYCVRLWDSTVQAIDNQWPTESLLQNTHQVHGHPISVGLL